MLHLPNNAALRKLTLCISVMKKGLSTSFPSQKSHPSGWVLAMFMDSLTSGVGTFPGNTSKNWKHWRQHVCRWKSVLLRRWSLAGSGPPCQVSPFTRCSHQPSAGGRWAVQVRCERPCHNSPGARYSTVLQRPGNHSFVHCHSLKACHKKYMETFPVFTSQDLDSYTKDLPVSLSSQ